MGRPWWDICSCSREGAQLVPLDPHLGLLEDLGEVDSVVQEVGWSRAGLNPNCLYRGSVGAGCKGAGQAAPCPRTPFKFHFHLHLF